MKNIYLILVSLLATSCATVGSVIEGGKDMGTGIVDVTVKTAGSVSGAALQDISSVVSTVAETYDGVIDTVVENVDKQTDELQDESEKSVKETNK
tara:strand:- start:288 stop:572 length:285 start_codon:yes stop_codon:yes gene_type:complete